jgi:hypothetical protein
MFSQPYGLDFDSEGNLWASDSSMNVIMRFDSAPGFAESSEDFFPQNDLHTIPLLPENTKDLILNSEQNLLLNLEGESIFKLDPMKDAWIPVVPEMLSINLPNDYQIEKDESNNWHITNPNGMALYSFDSIILEWIPITPQNIPGEKSSGIEDKIQTCEGANSPRISGVGKKVIVMNSLIPLRYSPSAFEANILQGLPVGTILEITSLPVCSPYLSGANYWWGVKTATGLTGFVAEGSAISSTYYLRELD